MVTVPRRLKIIPKGASLHSGFSHSQEDLTETFKVTTISFINGDYHMSITNRN